MASNRVAALRAEREEVLAFCRRLEPEEWEAPSGCPGWSVKGVVSHMGAAFHGCFTPWFFRIMRTDNVERSSDKDVAQRASWEPALRLLGITCRFVCASELPVLSAGSDRNRQVEFIGAAMQDSPAGVSAFEKDHPHPYPSGLIVAGSYQSYGVIGPPVTVFIDAQGLVAATFTGPLDGPTLDHYLGLITG